MPNDYGYAFAQEQRDRQEGPDPFIDESEENNNDTL